MKSNYDRPKANKYQHTRAGFQTAMLLCLIAADNLDYREYFKSSKVFSKFLIDWEHEITRMFNEECNTRVIEAGEYVTGHIDQIRKKHGMDSWKELESKSEIVERAVRDIDRDM